MTTVKSCACGRAYDLASWELLPCRGTLIHEDEHEPPIVDEYRDCPCGSSIAAPVADLYGPEEAVARLQAYRNEARQLGRTPTVAFRRSPKVQSGHGT